MTVYRNDYLLLTSYLANRRCLPKANLVITKVSFNDTLGRRIPGTTGNVYCQGSSCYSLCIPHPNQTTEWLSKVELIHKEFNDLWRIGLNKYISNRSRTIRERRIEYISFSFLFHLFTQLRPILCINSKALAKYWMKGIVQGVKLASF